MKQMKWYRSLTPEQVEEFSFYSWLGLHLAPVNLVFGFLFWDALGVI